MEKFEGSETPEYEMEEGEFEMEEGELDQSDDFVS